MDVMRLHSVGIVANDLDAMVDFLTGLGFELTSDSILDGDWLDSVLGVPGARINVIQLASPLGDSQLEVMKYEIPSEIGPNVDPTKPYAGQIRMIGVLCESLDDGIETALKLGANYIGQGTETVGDYRIAYVLGPEQVIFMLAEELSWWDSESRSDVRRRTAEIENVF